MTDYQDDPEAYYAEHERAMRPRNVTCYACGRTGTGSQMDLEKRGWVLNRQGEFCERETVVTDRHLCI